LQYFSGFAILDKRPPEYGGFLMEMNKPLIFLKEVKAELEKVVWPTREQTIRYSILVVVIAVATGLFLGGFDYLLTLLSQYLLVTFSK
jgi:preprotein translocase subunit SecE